MSIQMYKNIDGFRIAGLIIFIVIYSVGLAQLLWCVVDFRLSPKYGSAVGCELDFTGTISFSVRVNI